MAPVNGRLRLKSSQPRYELLPLPWKKEVHYWLFLVNFNSRLSTFASKPDRKPSLIEYSRTLFLSFSAAPSITWMYLSTKALEYSLLAPKSKSTIYHKKSYDMSSCMNFLHKKKTTNEAFDKTGQNVAATSWNHFLIYNWITAIFCNYLSFAIATLSLRTKSHRTIFRNRLWDKLNYNLSDNRFRLSAARLSSFLII